MGVRQNFEAGGTLKGKGTGYTGMTAGMAEVRLVLESRNRMGAKHPGITTEIKNVVNSY
jgi:predicted transcriptional regulator with HTH domain